MRKAASGFRWVAISVFVLSSSLNYLDRLLLAALAPTIKTEFGLSNQQYGYVLSVFSIVYALAAPIAGWFVDRVGLNLGIALSMSIWSLAGIGTGLTSFLRGLLVSRTVLGIGEAAGIPGAGKANALYLAPGELAFGTALNQLGITLGSVAAPLVAAALAPIYGWRVTFMTCGALGFLWIPLWLYTSEKIPPATKQARASEPRAIRTLLRDRRLWGLALANALVMTVYMLWTNWTTVYFVQQHHLTETQTNREFAWIPPVFATLGGFCGGWLAFRLIRKGKPVVSTRLRICWTAAIALLVTAVVPWMRSPLFAAGAISFSFFLCLIVSTNLYAMPIDFFGQRHAAFGVAILTAAFGLMQTFLSPVIGAAVDRIGFNAVCFVIAVLPVIGIAVLQLTSRVQRYDSIQIRKAVQEDVSAIAHIQSTSPEASQWSPEDYLKYDCWVAEQSAKVLGFIASREVTPGEREILNIVVDSAVRRREVGRKLIEHERKRGPGRWFLEVRESNVAAVKLYESMGFSPVGRRDGYYNNPVESAIVMKMDS